MSRNTTAMAAALNRWPVSRQWWDQAIRWHWLPSHRAAGALLVIAPGVLLLCVCLGPMVFGGMIPAGGDIFGFFFQVGLRLHHAYTTGELPFWNPNWLSGAPFLADPQSAVFYPPHLLLYWLLSAGDAMRANLLLHISSAYLGTYAFLRSLGLGRPASLYGALSYAFSGFVLQRLAGPALLMIAGLLPVLFFLGHQTLRAEVLSHRLLYAGGFAAGIALDVLIGFPQGTYYSLLAVSAYMVVMALDPHSPLSPRGLLSYLRRLVFCLGLPMLVGVALCAIQLLPSVEFVGLTNRAAVAGTPGVPGGRTIDGLSLSSLWGFVGAGPGGEQRTFYTGALALALAPLALVLRANRQSLFFGASAIVTLLMVTADRNPIRDLASLAIPGWTAFEDHLPVRALVYVVFCLAVLAAWAVDRPVPTMRWLPLMATLELGGLLVLIGRWSPGSGQLQAIPTQLRLPVAFLVVNVLLLSAWRTPWLRSGARRFAVPSIVIVLLVDLTVHYQTLGIGYVRLPESFGPSATAAFLASHSTERSRFLSMTRWGIPPYQDLANASTLLTANAGPVYGLEDAQGYNPLQLGRYHEFLSAANGPVAVDYHLASVLNPLSPLIRYLNMGFMVTDPSMPLTAQLVGFTQVGPDRPEATLRTATRPVRGLVVDSALVNSTNVAQGTEAAAVVVVSGDGTSTRLPFRAGLETAEWAYDRQDVRQSIQHDRPAAIARNFPAGPDFQGHTYRAAFTFTRPTTIKEIRFEQIAPQASWVIDQVSSDSESWQDSYQSVYDANGVRILQADEVLPRAYLTHAVEQIADGPGTLTRLQDSSFDPHHSVILEEALRDTDAELGQLFATNGQWTPLSTPDALAETADVVVKDANQFKVHVNAQRPGMLVLSETFYPAWRAYIDGRPAHIYRANYLFRAVAVPAGEHEVEMRYESTAFQVGLVVSVGTLISVLATGCCLWLRARRRSFEQVETT